MRFQSSYCIIEFEVAINSVTWSLCSQLVVDDDSKNLDQGWLYSSEADGLATNCAVQKRSSQPQKEL